MPIIIECLALKKRSYYFNIQNIKESEVRILIVKPTTKGNIMKRILQSQTPVILNAALEKLEATQESVKEIQSQLKNIREEITNSFSEAVVMFIDLVDSTAFKMNHSESEWILRVKLFVDVISKYAIELGGNVVKVIGDEVMITFTRQEQTNDSLNFVMRISEIEQALQDVTGFPTKIKIAFDSGSVCFIKYTGHSTADPQGTPVDRCARISKFCQTSTVLTSENMYLKFQHKQLWSFAGKATLKGIGITSIYQLGDATVKVSDTKSVPVFEYEELLKLKDENIDLRSRNSILQKQIRKDGTMPLAAGVVNTDREDAWKDVENVIHKLNALISGVSGESRQYARFIFLNEISEGEEYNRFEGKVFDELIQEGLVHTEHDNSWYEINPNHKRNQKIATVIQELKTALDQYIEQHGEYDENDLFDYSISDAGFWKKYIGYHVL